MSNAVVVAVVVTYNPSDVRPLLAALTPQCAHTIVVDNGSRERAPIEAACSGAGAELCALGDNLGIAVAQNRGIERALELEATHILLMDHDSLPEPDMVERLLAAFETDSQLAAVGPLAVDDGEGGDQLAYVARAWKPGRATGEELETAEHLEAGTLDVAFLIASGCLIRTDALAHIGLMREELFIDHVDLEWGLRARNYGWRLAVVPVARLRHRLGDATRTLPGRAQPVHIHGPVRSYYLVRNTVWLIRRSGLAPWKWRVRYVWWLAKYVGFNALLADRATAPSHESQPASPSSPSSPVRLRRQLLVRGLRDGLAGRMGRLGS